LAGNLATEINRPALQSASVSSQKYRPTNQSTRIATARFYNGYMPIKKWVIVATIAHLQSRDFKRCTHL
jgi:hypothetical protein